MSTRTVEIGSSVGLHARPAALFVQAVNDTGLTITICKPGGAPVPANSMLGVMALGAKNGETVELSSDDAGADAALDSLVELLKRDLDAE
ncbi:HPr family phosphocarrier protein [Demequina capsici]|uniref:Phosphocarrier protein HPr n=1 Tax=Demequina capsici TaxID=3075620 RepID=A0AA96F842_9MICO|nr:HPr family phosphocarrier protein [Demequina sp. OYTSA14]WNM25162.1 HPr family phosphocarrier protein [Demequina sp. OYTSA14]